MLPPLVMKTSERSRNITHYFYNDNYVVIPEIDLTLRIKLYMYELIVSSTDRNMINSPQNELLKSLCFRNSISLMHLR